MKDHSVELQSGKAYVITMTSDAFDTNLRLDDPLANRSPSITTALGCTGPASPYTPTATGDLSHLCRLV